CGRATPWATRSTGLLQLRVATALNPDTDEAGSRRGSRDMAETLFPPPQPPRTNTSAAAKPAPPANLPAAVIVSSFPENSRQATTPPGRRPPGQKGLTHSRIEAATGGRHSATTKGWAASGEPSSRPLLLGRKSDFATLAPR